jgi:hypothetical protein
VVQTVDRIGERQPRLDQGVEVALTVRIEVDVRGQRGIAPGPGADAQAERSGGLQGVDEVQVVRPILGEILPWVCAGIAADEPLLPVRGRTLVVMRLEAGAVVLALVAEYRPEPLQPDAVPNKTLPIVVAHLVAEVAEQRPVGLPHGAPDALAFGVVGLRDVDGDQTRGMACHDL